jgi:hypothetical protein
LHDRGEQLGVEDDDQRERDHHHDAGQQEHLDVTGQLLAEQELVVVDRSQPKRREVRTDQRPRHTTRRVVLSRQRSH